MEEPRYETVRVYMAAKRYKVNTDTIRRWIREGRIEAQKSPGGRVWLVKIPVKKN